MSDGDKPPFDFGILSKADIRLTIIFFYSPLRIRSTTLIRHIFSHARYGTKSTIKSKNGIQIRIGSTVNFHVKKKNPDV